ncbi:hypothetical protein ABEB36_005974 [Hypothenemus hampei]|uniref:Uncharacterized protein n=1 Tax=Hypothenemus hampei TaxID=57062 RepID=A0ABD1F024_HYPHA
MFAFEKIGLRVRGFLPQMFWILVIWIVPPKTFTLYVKKIGQPPSFTELEFGPSTRVPDLGLERHKCVDFL